MTTPLKLAAIMLVMGSLIVGDARATGQAPKSDEIPLPERIMIAADIRSDVEQYFAHWQGVPNLDFNAAYAAYIDAISKTSDRRAFDLATAELFASLRNGHTGYEDRWLWDTYGQRTGLIVHYRGGQWLVLNSQRAQVSPGTVIVSVDGKPIETFYDSNAKYIAASDDLARRNHLFNIGYLFGTAFTIGTAEGLKIKVNRLDKTGLWRDRARLKSLPDGVHYVPIPSFDASHFEDDALKFISDHADSKAIIIDVRMNGGGSTPNKLLHTLVTEPYTDWTEASAMSVGLLKAYANYLPQTSQKDDPEFYGFNEGMDDYFRRPMMYWPGQTHKPDNPVYKGRLIVLIDSDCASACEDFVMPLKVTHRATIIGERTFGSSGQPFVRKVSDEISYRVGAKRMFFGDGSAFEGVGIEPDISIVPTALQIKNNEDPVLQKALELAVQ